MEISPAVLKILTFSAGMAGAFVSVTYLKGTDLYAPAMLASGALLGMPVNAPGADAPVKALAAEVKKLADSIRPPQ